MATLISSSADLKANFSSIDASFTFSNIQQQVEDVERDTIGALIGPDALTFFAGNLQTADPVIKTALVYLQRSEAALAILQLSQTSAFRITDKALYLAKGADGVIPSDKKLTDFRNYCEESGNNFLDKAIDLMEANLTKFPAYADSGVRATANQLLFKTARDFSAVRNINNSRLTFLSLASIIAEAQDAYLPAYMTDAYYALFMERALDDELTIAEKTFLLPKVKKALAFLTIAQACKDLPVRIKGNGLFVNRYFNSVDYQMQDAAGQAQIDYLQDDSREKGERYLKAVQDYLNSNASSFPDYILPAEEDININSRHSGFYLT